MAGLGQAVLAVILRCDVVLVEHVGLELERLERLLSERW